MQMRLEELVFDARDSQALAAWWAEALGWVVHREADDEVYVRERLEADGSYPFPELAFCALEHPERGREGIHLDLNSSSLDDQRAIVERLVSIGATPSDVGQAADAPFVVLADPEGNNFCVLDPRPEYAHLGSLAGYTLAAHDAQALKELWRVATGWDVTRDEPDYVVLTPPDGGTPVEIITRPTMAHDAAKLRCHFDVRAVDGTPQAAVVEQLLALGATRADVGQDESDPAITWVVLADPEGNELCVLATQG
ncbi:VOC family protein [soil metagenome]